MNYFDVLNTDKKKIALFGASGENPFAKELLAHFGDKDAELLFPDGADMFTVHTDSELEAFADCYKICLMDIKVLESKICDVVKNSKEFERVTTVYDYELAYPACVGKVITRENYDVLFITGVKTVSDRYLARETVKCIKNAPAVYMFDSETEYFEVLRKAK